MTVIGIDEELKIKKRNFESLQVELIYHKYLYYELGTPSISDEVYDRLEKQSMDMAKEIGFKADKWADAPEENEKHHVHWMVGFKKNNRYWTRAVKKYLKL